MSRAFVREDSGEDRPRPTFSLPTRDDPSFDFAAAVALLEGARISEILEAEAATGYRWGEPKLRRHVERLLERARSDGDDRLEQVAARFMRQAPPRR